MRKTNKRIHQQSQESNSKVAPCNRTLISSAVAVALATSPAFVVRAEDATSRDPAWRPNVELRYVHGDGDFNRGQVAGLIPLHQTGNSLTYTDLRFALGNDSIQEGNIGVGHRRFTGDRTWILGGYAFYDHRRSQNSERYSQVTAGAEAYSDQLEFRANYYHPLTNEQNIGVTNSGAVFAGSGLFVNGVYEEALSGFDIEAGTRLPVSDKYETRAYAGYYNFDGDIVKDNADGWRARVEFRPRKNISIALTHQNDDLFGDQTLVNVGYSFGFDSGTGIRTLHERMVQLPERDIDIILAEGPSSSLGDKVQIASVVHIDGGEGFGGTEGGPFDPEITGTGTEADPYKSVYYCQESGNGIGCDNADIIHVHGDEADNFHHGTFELNNGQALLGTGVGLFDMPAGDYVPVLSYGSYEPLVTLANNNEVAGIIFEGGDGGEGNNGYPYTVSISNGSGGSPLIYGHNATGFNIHDNEIRHGDYSGIKLEYDNNSSAPYKGRIADNHIWGNGLTIPNTGISIETNLDGDNLSQSFTISGNNISYNYGDGIKVANNLDDDASLTQNLTISDNFIKGNMYVYGGGGVDGIDIISQVNSSILKQHITINDGNEIYSNHDDGIDIDMYLYNGSVAEQVVVINDFIIGMDGGEGNNGYVYTKSIGYGNGDDGINFNTGVHGESTLTLQEITISDGEIVGNMDDGIDFETDASTGSVLKLQNLMIADTTITDNHDNGIDIDNSIQHAIQKQTITISGTDIHDNFDDGIDIDTNAGCLTCKTKKASAIDTAKVTQKIYITDNGETISGNGDDGIEIYNKFIGSGKLLKGSLIEITGNTLSGNGGDEEIDAGIEIVTEGYHYASVNQSITITENMLTTGYEGIKVEGIANDEASLTQAINASDNTLTPDYGVYLYSGTAIEILGESSIDGGSGFGGGGDVAEINQSIILNNNMILSADGAEGTSLFDTGILLQAEAENGAMTTQTVTSSSGNTITAEDTGYGIHADGGEGGEVIQTVTSTGDYARSTGDANRVLDEGGNSNYSAFEILADGGEGSDITQMVTLNDAQAMADGGEGYGVLIRADVEDGGVIEQDLILADDTTVTSSGIDGIGIKIAAEALNDGFIGQGVISTGTMVTADNDGSSADPGPEIDSNNGGLGARIIAEAEDNGEIEQSFTSTDDTFTSYNDVIQVIAEAEVEGSGGGNIDQDITLNNAMLTGAVDDGLFIRGIADGSTSYVEQIVSQDGGMISSGDTGIKLDADASLEGITIQDVMLEDMTISAGTDNPAGDGLFLDAGPVLTEGEVTQEVTLDTVTVNAADDGFRILGSVDAPPSSVDQDVLGTDVTINAGDDDVTIDNAPAAGVDQDIDP